MISIDHQLINQVTGAQVSPRSFAVLGLVNSAEPDTLSFLDDERFFDELAANPAIAGAFVTPSIGERLLNNRPDIVAIESDDPRWAYYSLYNRVAEANYTRTPSVISPLADIHPSAFISSYNVTIGDRTKVGPNVTILADVTIGADCIVQAGTVIGSDGFEYKRTSRGVLFVFHDGCVVIGERVHIGANTCIDKGFRGRPTIISDHATVDNLVHVAHSARIGKRSLIIAGTVLGGSAVVGDDVWMSINSSLAPGITLEDGSFVSIGAVVTRRVVSGQQVTGNFAVPHDQFLRLLKAGLAGLDNASLDNT